MRRGRRLTGLIAAVCVAAGSLFCTGEICQAGIAPEAEAEAGAEDTHKMIADYQAYQERFEEILTIADIRTQGYEVVEKHVFDIPLVTYTEEVDEDGERIPTQVVRPEKLYQIDAVYEMRDESIRADEISAWRESIRADETAAWRVPTVRFYTAIDRACHRAAVFLADADGNIIYKTNQLECNYVIRGSLEQPITDMVSVAFMDVNRDERMDIILIAGCVNETGDYAGKQYKVGEVLFQDADRDLTEDAPYFYRDWRINDKLNRFGMNKSAKCILSFVRDGQSTEFLYTATTEEELLASGFTVFGEQSYWREYEKLGRLKVLPGVFSMADYDVFMVYMVNERGDIVWSFQPMGDMDNLYSLKGMSGKDMDGDGMKDLVIWAQYSKEGEPGELLVENRLAIYYQRTGGFDTDVDFVEHYEFTGEETMEELLREIRAYWGWTAEEGNTND